MDSSRGSPLSSCPRKRAPRATSIVRGAPGPPLSRGWRLKNGLICLSRTT